MKFPEDHRITHRPPFESQPGDCFGLFEISARAACGRRLRIIACDGEQEAQGWEHVSVSIPDQPEKCPSWDEMSLVKSLFWEPSECVVQFHPPESEHINNHAGCLHLWRYVLGIPMPPSIFVGLPELNLRKP